MRHSWQLAFMVVSANGSRTGNLIEVQLSLGHRRVQSTVRNLGIEMDDAIEIAEKIEI
jgi:hypothetical protein